MMRYSASVAQSGLPRPERRRGHRVQVLGQLHGRAVALRVPIAVRDLSTGGFSVEAPLAFPRHAVHTFRFTTPEGSEVMIDAESIRCVRASRPDDDPMYVTGFEFIASGDASRVQIDSLVESMSEATLG